MKKMSPEDRKARFDALYKDALAMVRDEWDGEGRSPAARAREIVLEVLDPSPDTIAKDRALSAALGRFPSTGC